MLNSVLRLSVGTPDGPILSGQAARMFKPGAITSGLIISGVSGLGPRAEKDATTGAGRIPSRVPLKTIVAVGCFDERDFAVSEMYLLISSPPEPPTDVAGNTWQSATRPSPSNTPFAIIIPTPPFFLTISPLRRRVTVAAEQATTVDKRVHFIRIQIRSTVNANAGNRFTVPEPHVRRKVAVDGSGADRRHPRRDVRHR
ncbi:hypothetical protein IGI04_020459 [Brassica rapa subsp. trilocularis]|uniref:Uncharacterized protein n=1 Tax=Brassica rapa subsp. trilocularis TaxID=1813537 RepID=A0ABQ7MJM4_BRACM|nr:hypothetical protein IGI04_020459 [Brassica rapa subsp. trilocularis]